MTKQLTTQNATITTATVEVKTLTISGKQVTLAVFRQLKEEPLIAQDGTLNGEPWGVVNYHPDKCGDEREHVHVVWQNGSDLRRSYVTAVPDFDYLTPNGNHLKDAHWYSSTAANRYLTALICMGLTAGNEPLLSPRPRRSSELYGEADSYLAKLELPAGLAGTDIFPVMATAPRVAVDAADLAAQYLTAQAKVDAGLSDYERTMSPDWQANAIASRRDTAERTRQKYEEAMEVLRAAVERCGGFDAVGDAYSAEIEAEEARRKRHREARARLADLPQLFIAV
ncbi:hypothetical protein G6W61_27845 [Streptomyces sp. KAI-26]|uniref:hypothetical protein n=1 Tax=Streptomyces sp. KAI-26 TaxID=1169747 RepID=UPI0015870852|nr:hypothetical protein [Streptomyces sp. KAI-26]NUV89977.1 hypothetical protein [Streptomyces sp. KAI-26]NUW23991.1 hypothetical protein [Streptomyces roseoviolaceus]